MTSRPAALPWENSQRKPFHRDPSCVAVTDIVLTLMSLSKCFLNERTDMDKLGDGGGVAETLCSSWISLKFDGSRSLTSCNGWGGVGRDTLVLDRRGRGWNHVVIMRYVMVNVEDPWFLICSILTPCLTLNDHYNRSCSTDLGPVPIDLECLFPTISTPSFNF